MSKPDPKVQVVVILGSQSDQAMVEASDMPKIFVAAGVWCRFSVHSAHRNADALRRYCRRHQKTAQVFIGIAGMAAALPGAITAILGGTTPVLGVALSGTNPLNTLAALLGETCLPAGVSVGYMGMDKAGLTNAAILACQIIGLNDGVVASKLAAYLTKTTKRPQEGIQIEVK